MQLFRRHRRAMIHRACLRAPPSDLRPARNRLNLVTYLRRDTGAGHIPAGRLVPQI